MALSEFQLKKIARLFEFYDGNNSGYIDEGDYDRIADRLAEYRSWAKGTSEYNTVHQSLLAKWGEASQFADTNNDNQISLDEWIKFWDTVIHNDEMYKVVVSDVRGAIIDAVDLDGDGMIDVNDWRSVLKIYSYDESLAEETFKTIDRDADGKVTGEEIDLTVSEFLKSNDESALGNYMFGSLD